MATAVRKGVTVVPPPDEIVLTLSEREASVLLSLVDHVSGNASTTCRAHTDSVSHALRDAAIEYRPRLFRGELQAL